MSNHQLYGRFLLLFTLFFLSCERKTIEEAEVVRPVMTQAVEPVSAEEIRHFTGFSKSGLDIGVSFRVPGKIESLPVQVGDQLSPGHFMASLDRTDFALEVEKAVALLDRARAESVRAQAQYSRIRRLYENESASRNELDSARAEDESARAAVEQATAALDLAFKQLSYTTLNSPLSECVVYEVPVEVNENVESGQTIARITCGRRLEVEVAVPENFIASIAQGKEVQVTFTALPGKVYSARVNKVSNVATQGSTFEVTVLLDQAHEELRSGMASQVSVRTYERDEKWVILAPSPAVSEDSEGQFVYVYEETEEGQGIARRREVKVGRSSADGLVIESGLEPGDTLITAGLRYLYDGRVVRKYEGAKF